MRLLDYSDFNLVDFALRWKKARMAALQVSLSITVLNNSSEFEILASVPELSRDAVLRSVFDYSRKFGVSASRHLGVSLEISDFSDLLQHVEIPCYASPWRTHNQAQVLERDGCESLSALGSFGCDYWREALDGLIMGAGDSERLSRHRSRGHGDLQCVDVLFSEDYTIPRVISSTTAKADSASSSGVKFGPVPQDVQAALEEIGKNFEQMKVRFQVRGFSEGVLYYELEAKEGVLCGAGGKLLHDSLLLSFAEKIPNLIARDVAPLAVYGGSS